MSSFLLLRLLCGQKCVDSCTFYCAASHSKLGSRASWQFCSKRRTLWTLLSVLCICLRFSSASVSASRHVSSLSSICCRMLINPLSLGLSLERGSPLSVWYFQWQEARSSLQAAARTWKTSLHSHSCFIPLTGLHTGSHNFTHFPFLFFFLGSALAIKQLSPPPAPPQGSSHVSLAPVWWTISVPSCTRLPVSFAVLLPVPLSCKTLFTLTL